MDLYVQFWSQKGTCRAREPMSAAGRTAEVSRTVLLIPFQFPNGGFTHIASGVSLMCLNEKRSRSSVSLRVANKTRSPFA